MLWFRLSAWSVDLSRYPSYIECLPWVRTCFREIAREKKVLDRYHDTSTRRVLYWGGARGACYVTPHTSYDFKPYLAASYGTCSACSTRPHI